MKIRSALGSIGLLVLGLLTLGGAAALIHFGAREPRAPAQRTTLATTQ